MTITPNWVHTEAATPSQRPFTASDVLKPRSAAKGTPIHQNTTTFQHAAAICLPQPRIAPTKLLSSVWQEKEERRVLHRISRTPHYNALFWMERDRTAHIWQNSSLNLWHVARYALCSLLSLLSLEWWETCSCPCLDSELIYWAMVNTTAIDRLDQHQSAKADWQAKGFKCVPEINHKEDQL